MDRFLRRFKRQSTLEEIAEEYPRETLGSEKTTEAATVPDGYELIEYQQPDGTIVTVRRKLATWQLPNQDSSISSRPHSSSPSFRTVISRTSDGRLARVQRPIRDLPSPSGVSGRFSQAISPRESSLVSSAALHAKPGRDTMRSTMTFVDNALAELSGDTRHYGRRGGSATTRAHGTAFSRTSGDIRIGHIAGLDGDDNDSDDSSSDYDERQDSRSECGQLGDEVARHGYRNSYGSCALLETAYYTQQDLAGLDAKKLPPTPSTAYYPTRDAISWDYAAKLRTQARHAVQRRPSIRKSSKRFRARRLIEGSSYLMACCSIVLPAAFLVLGILLALLNKQTVSPGRSETASVANIAAAIWPIVFAAVVAQGFKTWFLVKAERWNSGHAQVAEAGKLSQRLQALCLVVFLVWCLSPLGSQALERAYGLTTETQQTSTDVFYVDHTGYNAMWSANSTLAMSAATRSELVQVVSEEYISSLAPSAVSSDTAGSVLAYSVPEPAISDSDESDQSPKDKSTSSSLLNNSPGDLDRRSSLDAVAPPSVGTLSLSMITSHFEFTCGDWNLTLRKFDNTTAPTNMSYSESQTLGMSMSTGDDPTKPISTVNFASLNKITKVNDTTLVSRVNNSTSQLHEIWEYSSIQCGFEQLFYSKPVECEQYGNTRIGSCSQSAQESLIVTSVGLSSTELGDFAQDFVYANVPTSKREATATERYIQNGGSGTSSLLAAKRDEPGLLNLSATVSPEEFAQNFGQLFNTWVSLGYCPQCTSDILAGNTTVIPASVQPFYRQATATTVGAGDQVFVINWGWLIVFLVLAIGLLTAGLVSVGIEVFVIARSKTRRRVLTGDEDGRYDSKL